MSQPQGDGADRPFGQPDAEGRYLLSLEKRGPAFDGCSKVSSGSLTQAEFYRPTQPLVPVKAMLAQSLQSQSIQAVGECLNALRRRCFLDVIPTWTRLMRLAGVSVPVHRVSPRYGWEWTEMTEAVTKALRYATQVDSMTGLIQWGEADALLRGYAMDLAVQDEAVAIDDADPRHATFLNNLAAYRAFAEGRDSWLTTKAGL